MERLFTTSASAGSGVKPVGMTRCVTAAAAAVTGGVTGTARPLATTASGAAAAKLALAVRCVRFFASACTQTVMHLKKHVTCEMCHDRDAVHLPSRCEAEVVVSQPIVLTAGSIAGLTSHAPCAHTKHVAVATQPHNLTPKEPYLLVHRELDGIGGCARPQIVHPRLQSFLQGLTGAKVQQKSCAVIACNLTETSIVGGTAMHQSNTLQTAADASAQQVVPLAVRHQETKAAGSGGSGAHLPGIEVQRGQLAKVDVGHVHVEGLRLVDEGAPVCRHVHQDLHNAMQEGSGYI